MFVVLENRGVAAGRIRRVWTTLRVIPTMTTMDTVHKTVGARWEETEGLAI